MIDKTRDLIIIQRKSYGKQNEAYLKNNQYHDKLRKITKYYFPQSLWRKITAHSFLKDFLDNPIPKNFELYQKRINESFVSLELQNKLIAENNGKYSELDLQQID